MTRTRALMVSAALLIGACAQEEITLPGDEGEGAGGACGSWYPGGEADAGAGAYAIEEGAVFPCLVWESVLLNHEPTYLNIGEQHLRTKHGTDGYEALVIVVSAENCPNCFVLQLELAKRVKDIEAAGALMVAMARRDLLGNLEAEDFGLERTDEVLEDEGWPVDRWYVTNDAEGHLPRAVDVGTPWILLVDLETMRVETLSNMTFSANAAGVQALIEAVEDL